MIRVPAGHIRFCSDEEAAAGRPHHCLTEGVAAGSALTLSEEMHQWLVGTGCSYQLFFEFANHDGVRSYFIKCDHPGLTVLFKLRWGGDV